MSEKEFYLQKIMDELETMDVSFIKVVYHFIKRVKQK